MHFFSNSIFFIISLVQFSKLFYSNKTLFSLFYSGIAWLCCFCVSISCSTFDEVTVNEVTEKCLKGIWKNWWPELNKDVDRRKSIVDIDDIVKLNQVKKYKCTGYSRIIASYNSMVSERKHILLKPNFTGAIKNQLIIVISYRTCWKLLFYSNANFMDIVNSDL